MVRMQRGYEEIYANYEDKLFYFSPRNELVLALIKRYAPKKHLRILDLGCGTGNVLSYLSKHLKAGLIGLDSSEVMLQKYKGPVSVKLVQGDIYHPKFKTYSFDVILSLDVIEHLRDDVGCLDSMNRLLKKGGVAIIVVPAFKCLWSVHDELNHHFRRYSYFELLEKSKHLPGKRKVFFWNMVSFFPKLGSKFLFLRWISRFLFGNRKAKRESSDIEAFLLPAPINSLIRSCLSFESRWVSLGLPLPFGSSLVVIIKKS